MSRKPAASLTPLAKGALALSFAALGIFTAGLIVGGVSPHRPGEATSDLLAFILCRIISLVLAFSGWLLGFIVVLKRTNGPIWSAVAAMMLILILLLLLGFSMWRGTAAFHSNTLIP